DREHDLRSSGERPSTDYAGSGREQGIDGMVVIGRAEGVERGPEVLRVVVEELRKAADREGGELRPHGGASHPGEELHDSTGVPRGGRGPSFDGVPAQQILHLMLAVLGSVAQVL